MCNSLNIGFKLYNFEEDVTTEEIISLIEKLNKDETTGILLQLPIPKHLDEQKILDTIDYRKDIDGLTSINTTSLYLNKPGIVPCTPKGILTILKKYHIDLEGKNVVIVGRSSIVGKPLFNAMINQNATVTLCHSKTKNLKEHTLNADIIVTDIGKPHIITKEYIKEGSIVIDAGISRLDGKVVGDVDFENVKDLTSYITPVPGGVGPMTIASLAENIVEAKELQK